MKLNWDIRPRVMIVALIPTITLGVLLTALLTFWRLSDLDDALTQRGQATARQLATAAEFGLFSGNRDALQRLADSIQDSADIYGVGIYDRNGELLASAGQAATTRPPLAGRESQQELNRRTLRLIEPVRHTPSLDEDPYTLTDAQSLHLQPLGEVEVLISREALERRKIGQVSAAAAMLCLVLAAAVALAALMSRSVSQPIQRVAGAIAAIGNGNFTTRVPAEGGKTLLQLADGVNEMAIHLAVARDGLESRIASATTQLRERTEEAERANLAKSRFLAAASHDLRQPMHALGLFIAELSRKEHSAETRQLIERIAASAEAMENLLDSLLDISKLDAGVVTSNPRPFALGPIFERIGADYEHAARERGLRLRVRPTRLWVNSDPLLFERILINLISNALRYTQRGAIMLVARQRGVHVLVQVRDSGVGIAPEDQANVFLEFVQLENPARDRSKGLGLGLAIVRRLADLLYHPITIASRPGKGSIFGVVAPAARPEREISPLVIQEQEFFGKIVAVVDDDALAQESLVGLLRAWGCFVAASDSLDGLLGVLAELEVEPQILISDYRLPGPHTGLGIIAAARARFGARLPALLLSGDTGPETLREATEHGVPLLHKPVRPAKLRAAVGHLLQRAAERAV